PLGHADPFLVDNERRRPGKDLHDPTVGAGPCNTTDQCAIEVLSCGGSHVRAHLARAGPHRRDTSTPPSLLWQIRHTRSGAVAQRGTPVPRGSRIDVRYKTCWTGVAGPRSAG